MTEFHEKIIAALASAADAAEAANRELSIAIGQLALSGLAGDMNDAPVENIGDLTEMADIAKAAVGGLHRRIAVARDSLALASKGDN